MQRSLCLVLFRSFNASHMKSYTMDLSNVLIFYEKFAKQHSVAHYSNRLKL